jgi:hypothetical protein
MRVFLKYVFKKIGKIEALLAKPSLHIAKSMTI